MNNKILIAEDDEDIIKLLKLYLESEGYIIFSSKNGIDALQMLKETSVDLAIIDIMMPKMNGYELLKEIRKTLNIPVIILSAKSQDSDKILGLNIGADDYISKPFSPLEIIARVNANIRRYYSLNSQSNLNELNTVDSIITVGNLTLDTLACKLTKNNEEIILTSTEYKMVLLFMKHPGQIFTKVQIYENISGEYFESDDNTIMVHISNLRDKLEDDKKNPKYIKTIRGLGYKIEKL